ncbi:unnamed protein product [Rotaria sp. Silwood1]|nr:unnamed protein product [Rotaria sp. Silwood1]CAF1441779.1 unnamed protein product [Rotaria sp. Silwood1]CAF1464113.1 unnamed protein product [Rotaria sp. Silwood1]CAF3370323.1 unnamed protein product [Rotaria sp. Silwood1]CAF3615641.1 unnamed protein product [Rotaria sp. Silwood1]
MKNYLLCVILFLFLLICSISSEWITINDYSVTTWNEYTADRPKTLTTFKISNYPPKYVRSLNNRIDTYTYDKNNEIIYFIMDQTLYGISKFFKYNLKTNQIDQTEQIQPFMIDRIQFNPISNRLYAIIHDSTRRNYYLVEVDTETLQIKKQIMQLSDRISPMPGSYFNSQTQLFTYHAYDFQQDHTVLITLDLSDNATKIFVGSKQFDFNVYGFGYIQPDSLVALWQYSIITPMVAIKIDEQTGQQIKNVTITPNGVRIAQGYKPFSMDFQNKLFYVLSWTEDLSATYISKINMETMNVQITAIKGQIIKDYIFYKRE